MEASFKSDVRPVGEWIKNWVAAGVEIPSLALEQAQRRGIESFYQLAMNGYDVGWDGTKIVPMSIPMKAAHPEWLMWPYGPVEGGYMNYAEPGVRDYVTEIVREVAWRFDHDGINLDFARLDMLFPAGAAVGAARAPQRPDAHRCARCCWSGSACAGGPIC